MVERDALEIYTAVRPSGHERELPPRLPELSAVLHPHQRRAAAWMVDRETHASSAVRAFFSLLPLNPKPQTLNTCAPRSSCHSWLRHLRVP